MVPRDKNKPSATKMGKLRPARGKVMFTVATRTQVELGPGPSIGMFISLLSYLVSGRRGWKVGAQEQGCPRGKE